MAPPISYYNSPWGRSNSDFDDAKSHPTTAFSYAPARRSESPPQSRSRSPQRGSIFDLPSTRVRGYGQVMKAALDQGFKPPSRSSVQSYTERPLPATPTSVVSAKEMTEGRKGSLLPPTPTSIISAHEVEGEDGRARAVIARSKGFLPPSTLTIVPVDSPTLGPMTPAMVAHGSMYMLDTRSPSAPSTRSTVNSAIDPDMEAAPPSPAWLRRMRKRAEWTLRWWEQYRED